MLIRDVGEKWNGLTAGTLDLLNRGGDLVLRMSKRTNCKAIAR